jgi:hypothetical protein
MGHGVAPSRGARLAPSTFRWRVFVYSSTRLSETVVRSYIAFRKPTAKLALRYRGATQFSGRSAFVSGKPVAKVLHGPSLAAACVVVVCGAVTTCWRVAVRSSHQSGCGVGLIEGHFVVGWIPSEYQGLGTHMSGLFAGPVTEENAFTNQSLT